MVENGVVCLKCEGGVWVHVSSRLSFNNKLAKKERLFFCGWTILLLFWKDSFFCGWTNLRLSATLFVIDPQTDRVGHQHNRKEDIVFFFLFSCLENSNTVVSVCVWELIRRVCVRCSVNSWPRVWDDSQGSIILVVEGFLQCLSVTLVSRTQPQIQFVWF